MASWALWKLKWSVRTLLQMIYDNQSVFDEFWLLSISQIWEFLIIFWLLEFLWCTSKPQASIGTVYFSSQASSIVKVASNTVAWEIRWNCLSNLLILRNSLVLIVRNLQFDLKSTWQIGEFLFLSGRLALAKEAFYSALKLEIVSYLSSTPAL